MMMRLLSRDCCLPATGEECPDGVLRIVLVGNPNSGKSTVFNALTGACQRVGNWPGVTVEKKTGYFTHQGKPVQVVDLPGIYSLVLADAEASVDERIACEYLRQREMDLVINIVDAATLERSLYLTLQLSDLHIPVVLAVNMLDVAEKRGFRIDLSALAKWLGCPVAGLCANRKKGITELKNLICAPDSLHLPLPLPVYPEIIHSAVTKLGQQALPLLEGDVLTTAAADSKTLAIVHDFQKKIAETETLDADLLIADARYRFAQGVVASVMQKSAPDKSLSKMLDKFVLNRFFGVPVFLAVMYAMFFFAINLGGALQDFFDIGSHAIFVDGFAQCLAKIHTPSVLIALLANGAGQGINTTVTFIPVIAAMFFFLALLEDSGYMARAAFVMDRVMGMLGLPGKSFVPMIIGFGCNVPAVMATRTLEHERDRILTVMMSPFVSCGARLAIFVVFVAAFFPTGRANIIFLLYLTGILMAMLTGLLLRKTVLAGQPSPLVMELPSYHVPEISTLFRLAWQRLRGFVLRAGKLIIPISILLGALNTLNVDGTLNRGNGNQKSVLSVSGRTLAPVFVPMGVSEENWPATVGLLTGVLAKEVVIGTLNTLYSEPNDAAPATVSVLAELREALASVTANLSSLGSAFLGNPVLAAAPVHALSAPAYGAMVERFDGKTGAFAWLLFVLLYFPCISTVAAMRREVGVRWAAFSMLWSTGTAYCIAVTFYQLATLARHPLSSLYWTGGMAGFVALMLLGAHLLLRSRRSHGGAHGFA